MRVHSLLGEPSDGSGLGRGEDCVIVNAGGKWNDYPCTGHDIFGSICEAGKGWTIKVATSGKLQEQ